jgi:hypothetical protein
MGKTSQSKRESVSLLHQKLRSKIYKFAEKHGITTFEALRVLLYLATEISADALVADGVLKGGVDPGQQDDDAGEPVSAHQEIDDLNARIKELMGENDILDRGLDKMSRAAETLRQENMRLRVRIGGLHAQLKGIEPS